ncbi:MAG: YDG domain-containing protein, partial [Faecousia sp.]
TQATNEWTVTPTITGWTYGDTPSAYTGAARFGAMKVEYKVKDADDSTYTETQPQNAGTYTARFTVAATDNYAGLSEEKDFTISPKSVTVRGITAENKTYDGNTTATLKYEGVVFEGKVENDELTVTGTGVFADANAENDKIVTVTGLTLDGASKDNYILASEGQQTSATASISVLKIEKPAADSKVFTYTGSEQTYTLTESTWYTISHNTRTDAGQQSVTVSLKDTSNTQWKDGTTDDLTFPFVIEKAASSVTTSPAGKEVLYTGSSLELIDGGVTADGTLHYSLDGETWSAVIPTATECGTYTVYYKVVGDQNHNDIDAQSLTAEIVPFQIVPQNNPTTTTYGADTQIMVGVNSVKVVSYQWYQVTDVPLEGETGSVLHLAQFHASNTPYQFVCKITCGDYTQYSAPIPVTVNPAQLQGVNLSGYWAEGGEREIANGETVTLTSPNSRLLTKYTTATNTQGDAYPSGMTVYALDEDNSPVEIAELGNLLQYSGCSIRVSGNRGIRMITSLTKENKAALTGAGLAGFTLEEYGTVVQWADTLGAGSLTLDNGNHNFAYKKGVADPVFANVDSLTQYTNVLVGFDLDECSQDIVMRPYIILQDAEGNQYTLYGGVVSRSISYIAWQN